MISRLGPIAIVCFCAVICAEPPAHACGGAANGGNGPQPRCGGDDRITAEPPAKNDAPKATVKIPGTVVQPNGLTPEQLFFDLSWEATPTEKWAIRRYITQVTPDSPVAVAAKAWLALDDQRLDDALGLFRECSGSASPVVRIYCSATLLANDFNGRTAKDDVDRARELAAQQHENSRAVGSLYGMVFHYIADVMNDKATALRELERWKTANNNKHYLNMILGDNAERHERNYNMAVQYYREALDDGEFDLDPVLAIARIQVHNLSSASTPIAERMANLEAVDAYARKVQGSSRIDRTTLASKAFMFIADEIKDTIDSSVGNQAALDYYSDAFTVHPTGEAAVSYAIRWNSGYGYLPPDSSIPQARKLLDMAQKVMPGNPAVLAKLGYYTGYTNRAEAEGYYLKAIELRGPRNVLRQNVFDATQYFYEASARYDDAYQLYLKYVDLDPTNMVNFAIENRFAVGAYDDAAAIMARYKANDDWREFFDATLRRYRDVANAPEAAVPPLPTIATAGRIGSPDIAVSPDGKSLALDTNPIQIWDADHKVKVRDLGQGGKRRFSPDGRLLATISTVDAPATVQSPGGSLRYEIRIFDVASGRLVKVFYRAGMQVRDIAWAPTGNRLAFVTEDRIMAVVDAASGRYLASRLLPYNSRPNQIVWTKDGGSLVVPYQWGTRIDVLASDTLEVRKALLGAHFPHGLAIGSDGSTLVAIDNQSRVLRWSTKTWAKTGKETTTEVAGAIRPNPANATALVAKEFGVGDRGFAILDMKSGKTVGDVVRPGDGGAAFSPDGARIYRASAGGVEVIDAKSLQTLDSFNGVPATIDVAEVATETATLLTNGAKGIDAWDLKSGAHRAFWPDVHLLAKGESRIPGSGDRFIVRRGDPDDPAQTYSVLDAATRQLSPLLDARLDFTVQSVRYRPPFLALAGARIDKRTDEGKDAGFIAVYDTANGGQRTAWASVPLTSQYNPLPILTKPEVVSFDLTADGKEVAYAASWVEGRRTDPKFSTMARVARLTDGLILHTVEFGDRIAALRYGPDEKALAAVTPSGRQVRALDTGVLASSDGRWSDRRTVIELAAGQGAVVFGASRITRIRDGAAETTVSFPGNLAIVNAAEKLGLLIAITRQGEIQFFRLDSLEKLVTLMPRGDGEWLAFAPDGTFDASAKGGDGAYLAESGTLTPLASAADRYRRPDLLAERLARK